MIYYIQPMIPYSYEYVEFLTGAKVYWSFQDIACRKFPNVSYADVTIEAVIALENSLVQLPDIIFKRANENQLYIERTDISGMLEKAGLRAVTKIILKAIRGFISLDTKDVENIIAAVEMRNEIVHNSTVFYVVIRATSSDTYTYETTDEKVVDSIIIAINMAMSAA